MHAVCTFAVSCRQNAHTYCPPVWLRQPLVFSGLDVLGHTLRNHLSRCVLYATVSVAACFARLAWHRLPLARCACPTQNSTRLFSCPLMGSAGRCCLYWAALRVPTNLCLCTFIGLSASLHIWLQRDATELGHFMLLT